MVEMNNSEPLHPSAAQVARRALVLAAVTCRGSIDRASGVPEAEALYVSILEWLTSTRLWADVQPDEKSLLETPLGSLPERDVIRATWRVEGMAVLAWALKLLDPPRHDAKVDPYAVAEAVGFLSDEVPNLISAAELQPYEHLVSYRELLYAVHSRLRAYLRHPASKDFRGWIEEDWLDLLRVNTCELLAGDDLGIDGVPVAEADLERIREVEWVTTERHRAVLWLLGDAASYSEVHVDT